MKKFTFITTLLLAFVSMAALAADKPFRTVKVANADTWEMHGNCSFEAGKITNTSASGGRAYNTKFADAYEGVEIPETGYKVSTVFTYGATGDANKNDFCIALLNSALTPGTTWVAYGTNENAIFALEQIYSPNAAGSPNNKVAACAVKAAKAANATAPTEEEIASANIILTPGTKYQIDVNVAGQAVTYAISSVDAEGNLTAVENGSGSYELGAEIDNKVTSLYGCLSRANSNVTFESLVLSTFVEGEVATAPVQDLFWVEGGERDYFVEFKEGEILHWIQLGDAEDVVTGTTYTHGEEYTISFSDAMDSRSFEAGEECGKKIITCLETGELKIWTSREDDDTNVSDIVTVDVDCSTIQLPTPTAAITNVIAGFDKEYTLTVDNSSVVLKPIITIHYTIKDKSGNVIDEKDILTGEKVNVPEGSIEFYSWDKTHVSECYNRSEVSTIQNTVEYEELVNKNYAVSFDEAATLGLTERFRNVDLKETNGTFAAQSHWERIYSEEERYYAADGSSVASTDDEKYSWTKKGFGVIASSEFTSGSCGWNVYSATAEQIKTAFLPIVPAQEDVTVYAENGWTIFPLEGIVYDSTTGGLVANNAEVGIDPQYISDDESKPNFYVVHTRGGYDRPDKGDCNKTTVVKAGEIYGLYRFDTAICDVRVLTYKGFTPDPSAINGVVEKAQNSDNRIFNLAGQLVNGNVKGIMIKNGKKFIVK